LYTSHLVSCVLVAFASASQMIG